MRVRHSFLAAFLLAIAFLGAGATPQGHITLGATASAQMPVQIVFPPTASGGGGPVNRTDNFNRADTSTNIGTPSDGGAAWVQTTGTWGIATNQGYTSVATAYSIAELQSNDGDVDVQVTLNASIVSAAGLVARVADANNYILFWQNNNSGELQLYKNVAGTFTPLGTSGHSFTSGDVLKLTLSGSTVNAYINGSLAIGPVTVTEGQTNSLHGLHSYNSTDVRFDDFSITVH